jgi:hypothetical protein
VKIQREIKNYYSHIIAHIELNIPIKAVKVNPIANIDFILTWLKNSFNEKVNYKAIKNMNLVYSIGYCAFTKTGNKT